MVEENMFCYYADNSFVNMNALMTVAFFIFKTATPVYPAPWIQSTRALACTATGPLGEAGQLIIDNYLAGHRSRSLLDTDEKHHTIAAYSR